MWYCVIKCLICGVITSTVLEICKISANVADYGCSGNTVYKAQTGVTSVVTVSSECHSTHRPQGFLSREADPQSLHQGWIPKRCHLCLPAVGWIVSAAVATGTGPQDEGLSSSSTLLYSSRLSQDWRLMEREKEGRGGGEWRKSPETLAGLAGRREGRETSGRFMLSVWLKMKARRTNADVPSVCFVSCTSYDRVPKKTVA